MVQEDITQTKETPAASQHIRCVSWNVNGLRAVLKKDPSFEEIFASFDADIFAIQETKLKEGQVELALPGYYQTWSHAERAGYSGTAVFSRQKPLQTIHTIGCAAADDEGRICALEFDKFWFVDVYTPNAKQELARLDERMAWDSAFRDFLHELDTKKPVITCGDYNVAHQEIDLKNPKTNHFNPGFSDEERASFTSLLNAGFTDTFRYLHPTQQDAYSWWSYRFHAREKNVGWRIDYFLVSNRLAPCIKSAEIYPEVVGSDHCPVGLCVEI